MTEIFIVRHGNTFSKGDIIRRVGGSTDIPLTEEGEAQAQALGRHFADIGVTFDAAVTSPLLRTRRTAALILSAQQNPPELQRGEFLREIDYGPDENAPEDDVRARLGAQALMDWDTKNIVPPGWLVQPDEMRAQWRAFFNQVVQRQLSRVLVATSNGTARFALDELSERPDHLSTTKLRTGAYGVIEAKRDGTSVLNSWNIRP